jgi:hypothetical protein
MRLLFLRGEMCAYGIGGDRKTVMILLWNGDDFNEAAIILAGTS